MSAIWALTALTPLPGRHVERFDAWAPALTAHLSAAQFDSELSPTPAVSQRGQNIRIEWPAVTLSSGEPVGYTVLRLEPNLQPSEVCSQVDPTPVAGTALSCRDFKPAAGSSYTVQAFAVDAAGTATWTLPSSNPVGI